EQNFPNPFNPSTTIRFQVPRNAQVKLTVFNMLGQKVRTLLNEAMGPGYYDAVWDGRNDTGVNVSSGVYIYKFEAGNYTRVRKMMFLK
ncbi:MAG: T9SS type A sorting domain-containing protein, partial [bacterium]